MPLLRAFDLFPDDRDVELLGLFEPPLPQGPPLNP